MHACAGLRLGSGAALAARGRGCSRRATRRASGRPSASSTSTSRTASATASAPQRTTRAAPPGRWASTPPRSPRPPAPRPPPCGAMRSPPVWIRSPRLGRWRLLESVSQSSPLATGALGGRRSRCPCRATPSVDPGGYTGAVNPRRHRVAVDPGGYGGAASARTRGRAHRRAHPRAAAQFAFPVPRVWGIPAGFLSFRDIGDSF